MTKVGSIGRAAVVPLDAPPFSIFVSVALLRPNCNRVIPDYLCAYLNTRLAREQFDRHLKGIGVPDLHLENIAQTQVLLPNKTIQTHLANLYKDAWIRCKKRINQADSLLKSLNQYILEALNITIPQYSNDNLDIFAVKRKMIGKRFDPHANHPKFQTAFRELHEKCNTIPLGKLAECIFSGITPKAGGDAYTQNDTGIVFIKSGSLSYDGTIDIDFTSRIKEDVHNGIMKSSKLRKNDVLIAIVGATIGKVGLYEEDMEANINQAIAAVRLRTDKLLPQFLICYLLSDIGQIYLEYLQRPVARANINLQEIAEIEVPLPELSIQRDIVKEMESRRNKARHLRRQAEKEWMEAKRQFEKELLGE